jgi:hypothetical protein
MFQWTPEEFYHGKNPGERLSPDVSIVLRLCRVALVGLKSLPTRPSYDPALPPSPNVLELPISFEKPPLSANLLS